MGLALTVWQNVEEQHYHLFLKLLGSQEGDISSVVYFSVESFEARRRMVSRMVHYYSTSKELRIAWNKIEKQLKDHNESRNKIAHYGIYYDFFERDLPDGKFEYTFALPSLQPSRSNSVNVLLGRTSDEPAHNLGAAELDAYIRSFGALAQSISKFREDLIPVNGEPSRPPSLPPPAPDVFPPPPLETDYNEPVIDHSR